MPRTCAATASGCGTKRSKRIGHLYPPIEITTEMAKDRPDLKPLVGKKLTVIAWLWARTVKSPNPAFSHVDVPLASTFILSSKEGKEAYVQPVIEGDKYSLHGEESGRRRRERRAGTKAARGANFRCLMSGSANRARLHHEPRATARTHGTKLMAIVAEGNGDVFICPAARACFDA